jgi:hypothetical protein
VIGGRLYAVTLTQKHANQCRNGISSGWSNSGMQEKKNSVSFLFLPPSCFLLAAPLTERILMTTTIPTLPDEETPLLGGQQVSAAGRITESEPEAATPGSLSSQGSRTSTIVGKTNADEGSDVVKKTPLPWAQFSIVLVLQLAEPLSSQVIYPVSSPVGVLFSLCFFLTPV